MNQYAKFATGDYQQQFKLAVNPENTAFVNNPYMPGKCAMTNIVEFDVCQGAQPCYPQQTQMLNYDVQGNIAVGSLRLY